MRLNQLISISITNHKSNKFLQEDIIVAFQMILVESLCQEKMSTASQVLVAFKMKSPHFMFLEYLKKYRKQHAETVIQQSSLKVVMFTQWVTIVADNLGPVPLQIKVLPFQLLLKTLHSRKWSRSELASFRLQFHQKVCFTFGVKVSLVNSTRLIN